MKFWQAIMADFIQPFLADKSKSEADDHASKKDTKDEQNTTPRQTGMGDFDYENYPFQDSELEWFGTLDEGHNGLVHRFCNDIKKYKVLVQRFGDNVDETAKEYWCCADRLDEMEKEMRKRMELNDICSHMFNEQLPKVQRSSELIENFGYSLIHQNEVLDSWHCFIEEFRKIPEERVTPGYNECTCNRE